MKSDFYKINNAVEKIKMGRNTQFLDEKELKLVTRKLRKNEYNIYKPYKDSEKVILYTAKTPKISLYKINTVENLRHQDILGALFSLNISKEYFGDIVLYNDNYYIYIANELSNYIKNNLIKIANKKVELENVSLSTLENYKRNYEELKIIVSSLRIDSVLSSITNLSRTKIIDKIKNKEVIINYEVLSKNSYILKDNDIFSIRRFGKYKYVCVIGTTKKNNYIVKCLKYL